jgi:phenylacetate-CoA ligase
VLWRDFWRVGVGVADMQAKIWGYGKPHAWANTLAPMTRRLHLDALHAGDHDLARWVEQMRARSVDVVYGYASAVFALSRFLHANHLRIPCVRVVCTTAERLHPEMREAIAAAFSVPVVDMYGAHETVRLASECVHGGMHVDTDAAVLELVEDEESAISGKRVLLTTLLNRAMPFIRYDLGDRADPVAEPCTCGEHLPLVSIRSDRFRYPASPARQGTPSKGP